MKKIVLYGNGSVFKNVIRMLNPSRSDVIAVVDKQEGKHINLPARGLWWDIPQKWGGVTRCPGDICNMDFDYILLCSDLYIGEMRRNLHELHIPEYKIVNASNNDFDLNYRHLNSALLYNRNDSLSHKVLVELTDCEIFDHIMCRQLMIRRERLIDDFQRQIGEDYVRISTIELLAARIKNLNVEGSVAEAGVYKGDTAKYINELFPDRRFFMFDTFDSFNQEVMSKEKGAVSDSFVEAFKDTSVEYVMSKMKYPDQCVVRKGVFPDTAEGLEDEKWAFVSLDMDLYESTYAGLKYFYKHLQNNGYIIVHDCLHHQENNGTNSMPAGRALDRFCDEEGINYIPVTDIYGSAIITKQKVKI